MDLIIPLLTLIRALTADGARLTMENEALRQVESGDGDIISMPVFGELPHTYRRSL